MSTYHYCGRIISRLYDADVPYTNVTNICYEAMVHGFDGVQVFPNTVELCKKILVGSLVHIYALIAYPHGTFWGGQKADEIGEVLSLGAHGVEVCINCLNARSEDWDAVRE